MQISCTFVWRRTELRNWIILNCIIYKLSLLMVNNWVFNEFRSSTNKPFFNPLGRFIKLYAAHNNCKCFLCYKDSNYFANEDNRVLFFFLQSSRKDFIIIHFCVFCLPTMKYPMHEEIDMMFKMAIKITAKCNEPHTKLVKL